MLFSSFLAPLLTVPSCSAASYLQRASPVVNQTQCNGKQYTYQSLAGYGLIPSNARDKYGDTIGGIGSSIALDQASWKKAKSGCYTGILWAAPDRGWNTQGTLIYQNRVHKIAITFTPAPTTFLSHPSPPNLQLKYLDTVLFTGADGTPVTGLDADVTGSITYPDFPSFPSQLSPAMVSVSPASAANVSPSTTKDSSSLLTALSGYLTSNHAPAAYIPSRNGSVSFSADSPPIYAPDQEPVPADPESGRNNNQGLKGLTVSADGKTLYALLQSALNQEGGPDNPHRRQARLLEYDISNPRKAKYKAEFVVTLPLWTDPKAKKSKAMEVAAQSDIHSLGNGQFLNLARDSGAGHGADSSTSIYRHADIFDITAATDIKSAKNDATKGSIADSTGKLDDGIKAAEYCPFLDYNVNGELGKFGLHNGGAQDAGLLNEKWESFALAPVDGKKGKKDGEWFLISLSDNDFITQDGHLNFGAYNYSDESGYNVDNQALVFQIQLPKSADPS